MEKNDFIKSIVSVLVIIILAVLIVNANKLISPKAVQESSLPTGNVVNYMDCFEDEPSTVVFVHSNSCPHCRSMMPIIEELEEDGYEFYWAESSNIEAREMVSNCFGDLLSGYVPQFICPATGKEQTGGMSKAELKKFADNCIQ